jgi:hypothetical protein
MQTEPTCSFTQLPIKYGDGSQRVPQLKSDGLSSIMYRLSDDGVPLPMEETELSLYCPVWQHHAVVQPALVNFNFLTISDVADAFATVTSALEPIKVPVTSNHPFGITRNDEESDEESFSWLIHAVLDDGDVVGLVVSVVLETEIDLSSLPQPDPLLRLLNPISESSTSMLQL